MTLSNISLQALGLLYRMMLTKYAGSEALGLQSLVMQVYAIMASVCISGFNVAVTALAARIGADGNPGGNNIRGVFRAALLLFILIFASMALPLTILRKGVANNLIGDAGAAGSIVLVMLCILMTGVENILKSLHIATGRVGKTAVSELLEQSVRFLLVLFLLRHCHEGEVSVKVKLIMLGMLGSEFVSVGFLSASYKRLFGNKLPSPDGGIGKTAAQLIPILAPACLTSVAGTVFEAAAALLLPGRLMMAGYTRMAALSSIGTLGAAAIPLVMLPMAFIGPVAIISMPMVSAASASGDTAQVRRIITRCLIASTATVVLVNVPAIAFLGKLTEKLFGVVPTRLCFVLLTVKAGMLYYQITVRAILNGLMKQKSVLLFAVIGEAIQLLLIILLSSMPELHIYGYLIAACIGEGVEFVISGIYLMKLIKRPDAR